MKMRLTFTRGRGLLNTYLYGEAPPRGPTPYPFIYHFRQKRYPLRITAIRNGAPFTHLLKGKSSFHYM